MFGDNLTSYKAPLLDGSFQLHNSLEHYNTHLKIRIELEQKLVDLENQRYEALSKRTIEIEKQLVLTPEIADLQSNITLTPIIPQEQNSGQTSENNYLAVLVQQNMRGPNYKGFSGDSLHYPEFMLDFEQSITCVKNDPKLCLGILKSMLVGRALNSK